MLPTLKVANPSAGYTVKVLVCTGTASCARSRPCVKVKVTIPAATVPDVLAIERIVGITLSSSDTKFHAPAELVSTKSVQLYVFPAIRAGFFQLNSTGSLVTLILILVFAISFHFQVASWWKVSVTPFTSLGRESAVTGAAILGRLVGSLDVSVQFCSHSAGVNVNRLLTGRFVPTTKLGNGSAHANCGESLFTVKVNVCSPSFQSTPLASSPAACVKVTVTVPARLAVKVFVEGS